MTDIVKICKIHGELSAEKSLKKINKNRTYYLCKECHNDHKRITSKSPEKYKKAEELKQLLHLGQITKICNKHGELPADRIRINSRAEIICRICVNEISIRAKEKDKDYWAKKCKEWRKKNPEKLRAYWESYKPQRRINQKKYYKEWMKDPEKKKIIRERNYKSSTKKRIELSDSYVRALIKTIRTGGRKNQKYFYLESEIPKEVLEIKKLQIQLRRKLKQQRDVKNGN